MLNADKVSASEKQSIRSDAMNVPIDALLIDNGLQTSATVLRVAATNKIAVVKRPWMFRLLGLGLMHC